MGEIDARLSIGAVSLTRQTVHLIAAARPNFMKVAPLWHALAATDDFAPVTRVGSVMLDSLDPKQPKYRDGRTAARCIADLRRRAER